MKKREIDPLEEIMSNPYYQLRDEYNDAEKIKWTILVFGFLHLKYIQKVGARNYGKERSKF